MAVQISGNDITVPRDGSFTRNVTIGGTLTYEDVTNIDSVGLVTARTGIEIGARPGVAASISVDGNMIISGISTFGDDITFTGATSGRDVVFDTSLNQIRAQDNAKLCAGSSSDLEIFHNGTNSLIDNYTGALLLRNNVSSDNGGNIVIQAKVNEDSIVCNDDGAVELYYNNQKKIETTDTGVRIPDSQKYEVGTGADLLLFHNGTNNYIRSENGTLYIDSSGGEQMVTAVPNGAVELYYNNSKKLATTTNGIKLNDDTRIGLGDNEDLQIIHNGSDSQITDTGTGSLALGGSAVFIQNASHNANMASFVAGAEANLFYNGTKTFETQNGGVKVTGDLTFASNGNALDFQNQTITSTSNYNRTVTGEKLDYYEEGYLDPTAISAGLTWDTSSNRQLRYVRIGHFVSVSGFLILSSRTSNSNAIQIAMPYQSAPNSSGYYTRGVGAVMMQYITLDSGYDSIVSYVGGGENYMRFFQIRHDGSGWTELKNSNLGGNNNTQIYFSINYMVA